jgi:antimicrobial peptide system SdpB family protein
MLPLTLTDSRRWHWSAQAVSLATTTQENVRRLVALASMVVIRVQVSGIYFHAAVGKLKVAEWQDGTAMYYWFGHPVFGVNPHFRWLIDMAMSTPAVVTAVTWGSIVLELFLCMGLLAVRRARTVLLVGGIAFHAGILLFMGLFTFSITMFAALILYLRPWDEPFSFAWLVRGRDWGKSLLLRRTATKPAMPELEIGVG